ncbi:thiol peroxidase [Streptococcus pneumoniae]
MATFLGQPVTFETKQLQVGDTALDFTLINPELEKISLSDFSGKKKVLSIVPSIDTGICSTQTRRFNQELSAREDAVVITISMDLPFAQKRWCGAAGLDKAVLLSDYFDHSFGEAYGLLMNEWHLLARAILVLDETNKIGYVEYLDNINSEPDYEAALSALNQL